MDKADKREIAVEDEKAEVWTKPEVVSYAPVRAAQGISYLPSDGVSNLTP